MTDYEELPVPKAQEKQNKFDAIVIKWREQVKVIGKSGGVNIAKTCAKLVCQIARQTSIHSYLFKLAKV